jgi:hypothetical protein
VVTLRCTRSDGGVHLLNGDTPLELRDAPFELRCPDLGQNNDSAIGLQEELEPIARFEFQLLSHQLEDRRLVLAADVKRSDRVSDDLGLEGSSHLVPSPR